MLMGVRDASTARVSIKLSIYDFETQTYNQSYNLPGDFSANEWVYIGFSITPTNRIDLNYDVHLVSDTLSGVQNQASFTDQSLILECGLNVSFCNH